MNRSLLILAAQLIVCAAVQAQQPQPAAKTTAQGTTPVQPTQKSGASSPVVASQSADVAEADRLSQTVVQLYRTGKFAEALPLAERTLRLREGALGPDDPSIALALSNLAGVLVGLEEWDAARAAYERALPLFERRFGADDELTNQTREGLAGLYFKKGDYKPTRVLLERTLASREKTFGTDDKRTVSTLVNLGFLYMVTREAEKRDAIFRRLLDLASRAPDQLPDKASELFGDYICTGATHPYATKDQKEIEERIQQVWYARRYRDQHVVTGGVLNGRAVERPQPGYPPMARESRVQGTVLIRIVVDETGKVIEAAPVCGPRLLQGAGVEAAKRWRFTPTLLDGVPVMMTGTISFNFVLR